MSRLDNRLSAWQDLQGKLKTICLTILFIFWQRSKRAKRKRKAQLYLLIEMSQSLRNNITFDSAIESVQDYTGNAEFLAKAIRQVPPGGGTKMLMASIWLVRRSSNQRQGGKS